MQMEGLSPCWGTSLRQECEQGQGQADEGDCLSGTGVSEQLSPQKPGLHPHQAIDSEKLKDEK